MVQINTKARNVLTCNRVPEGKWTSNFLSCRPLVFVVRAQLLLAVPWFLRPVCVHAVLITGGRGCFYDLCVYMQCWSQVVGVVSTTCVCTCSVDHRWSALFPRPVCVHAVLITGGRGCFHDLCVYMQC